MSDKNIEIVTLLKLSCPNHTSAEVDDHLLIEGDSAIECFAFAKQAGWALDLWKDIALCPDCVSGGWKTR
jgi:hypothetical protein